MLHASTTLLLCIKFGKEALAPPMSDTSQLAESGLIDKVIKVQRPLHRLLPSLIALCHALP